MRPTPILKPIPCAVLAVIAVIAAALIAADPQDVAMQSPSHSTVVIAGR